MANKIISAHAIIKTSVSRALTRLAISPVSPPRDAFIASTGCVPGESKTLQENALNLARMALEMQRLCSKLHAPDGSPVVMRVGLHCGPVVGGIVGGNSACRSLSDAGRGPGWPLFWCGV